MMRPHVQADDANAKALRPKRSFTWYALTALALIAIVLLNTERRIVSAGEDSMAVAEISVEEVDSDPATEEKPHSSSLPAPKRPKPIQQISILGERNSGTRWLYGHLGGCFNQSIGVKRYLTRYKHWFQYKNATKYPHDTLVIASFRNPYDWFEALRNVPHHAPEHIGLKWEEFLTKPWTTERVGLDLNISKNVRCQEDFPYDEIVSCVLEPLPKEAFDHKLRYSENQPFYELKPDGSGEPFANIMEMRAAKIRNFLAVRDYPGVADVWTVQYEYLLSRGTEHLLSKIEEWTGIKRHCEAIPAQQRRKRPLSRTFAKFLNKELDWSAEGLIGYAQEEVS